jgi:threonine synthase
VLGQAPDVHCLPVGNAGNITAYWRGYQEYLRDGVVGSAPRMLGFQAAGAAPLVHGRPVPDPETIATAIRVGSPASWKKAVEAKDASEGRFDAVTDEQILHAYRLLAAREGVFAEPASASSVAGLLAASEQGEVPAGSTVVCTLTGNGHKDPDTALSGMVEVEPLPVDPNAVATALELT